TLNLGLRYDVFGPLSEVENRLSNWDPATKTLLVAGKNGVSKTAGVHTDFTDVGPRAGFSASLPRKMVLRGGWGIAYYPNNKNAGAFMKNPPFIANYGPVTSAAASNGVPNMFLSDGLPPVEYSSALNPIGNVIGTDLDYKSDLAHQFNVMIEKEFAGNVVTAGLPQPRHCTQSHTQETRRTPWDFSINETGDTPNFDVRHHWVLTSNYELPWGKGLTGMAHGFLSNWQLNTAAFWQSGVAFTVVNAASRTNTGGTDRPKVVGQAMLPKRQRTLQRWVNTAAYTCAPK